MANNESAHANATAGTSPFAHLAKTAALAATIAAGNARAESDDEDAKAKKKAAEDKEKEDAKAEEDKKKEDAKAEEDKKKEDAKKAEEDDKKKEDAKAKDGDDDTDEDDKKNAAALRERGRIKAIILSATEHNYLQACKFAFETRMTRGEAIAVLSSMKQPAATELLPRQDALRQRMADTANPDVGGGDARPAANLAEQIIAAGAKRRGEKI